MRGWKLNYYIWSFQPYDKVKMCRTFMYSCPWWGVKNAHLFQRELKAKVGFLNEGMLLLSSTWVILFFPRVFVLDSSRRMNFHLLLSLCLGRVYEWLMRTLLLLAFSYCTCVLVHELNVSFVFKKLMVLVCEQASSCVLKTRAFYCVKAGCVECIAFCT